MTGLGPRPSRSTASRYDIARARRETYAHPGALPDVAPAPLAEDLERRDFTVNAIALALAGDRAGELTSVPPALEDLDARRLRVLHDQSFIDDPTRLLRLVRYATRLGFEIEPHTRALADRAIAGGALRTVSGPRVGAELRLLAREPDPVRALAGLGELGLDGAIHPGFGLEDADLARRALALLPDGGRRDRIALAVAAREVPAPELGGVARLARVRGRRPRRDRRRRDARRRPRARAERGARAVGDRERRGRGAGGAGRARRRARAREAGPRMARGAPPCPADDRRWRSARGGRSGRPGDRARAARRAGREARPAGVRARAGARRGARRRRRAPSSRLASMQVAPADEVARAFLCLGASTWGSRSPAPGRYSRPAAADSPKVRTRA